MPDETSDEDVRLSDATLTVHAGLPEPVEGDPFLPGPTFAAAFHKLGDPKSPPHIYGRYGNPTWDLYEQAIGELEGGTAVVFSSGLVESGWYSFVALALSSTRPRALDR